MFSLLVHRNDKCENNMYFKCNLKTSEDCVKIHAFLAVAWKHHLELERLQGHRPVSCHSGSAASLSELIRVRQASQPPVSEPASTQPSHLTAQPGPAQAATQCRCPGQSEGWVSSGGPAQHRQASQDTNLPWVTLSGPRKCVNLPWDT